MIKTLAYCLLIGALKKYLGFGDWVWWALGICLIIDGIASIGENFSDARRSANRDEHLPPSPTIFDRVFDRAYWVRPS
jgi:hypothetical protein